MRQTALPLILLSALAAITAGRLPSQATPEPSPPTLGFDGSLVWIEGLPAGGSAVLTGAATTFVGFNRQDIRIRELLVDDDGDGIVVYDFHAPVAERSLWAAVDLASGLFAVASPNAVAPEVPFPPGALVANERGAVTRFAADRQALEMTLVRPGEGAWAETIADAGAYDEDGEPDGRIATSFTVLRPVGATAAAAPAELRERDVLLLIDPDRMVFFGARFTAPAGGAQ